MLFAQEVWFPALDSQSVVGRVVELEKPHPAKSREAQRPINVLVPVMLHKVAGSADYSVTELKPHTKGEICARFPGAWEYYEKQKASTPEQPAEIAVPAGTPIDKADWIPREKLAWLAMQGFQSVEQLAAMSDTQIQTLGPGARTWAKKAKQFLAK